MRNTNKCLENYPEG